MDTAAQRPRHNRTLTIDFHDETTELQLRADGKACVKVENPAGSAQKKPQCPSYSHDRTTRGRKAPSRGRPPVYNPLDGRRPP